MILQKFIEIEIRVGMCYFCSTMKKKEINQQDKQSLFKKMNSKLNETESIVFAYIFGSYARDEKFSDVDVGVFINEDYAGDHLSFELSLERELESLTRLPIDVRIINKAPLSFIYHVIKEGILVVDKDVSKRADFEGMIFKKYFDFSYYRKQYLKEVINAPL